MMGSQAAAITNVAAVATVVPVLQLLCARPLHLSSFAEDPTERYSFLQHFERFMGVALLRLLTRTRLLASFAFDLQSNRTPAHQRRSAA